MTTVIAAADPGGAEIVSAYAKSLPERPRFILEGPAINIFESKFGSIENSSIQLIDSLSGKDFVLTATSLVPELEREVVSKCKEQSIRVASWFDHWFNYKPRLKTLPNEIWLCDEYAKAVALQEGFPEKLLKVVGNPHLEEAKAEIAKINKDGAGLLVLGEPLSLINCPFSELDFAEQIKSRSSELVAKFGRVVFRPHPKENFDKYTPIFAGSDITVSRGKPIIQEVVGYEAVLSVQSMGLVLALLAGKQVYSLVLDPKFKCHLPHKEIAHLTSIEAIL